MKPFIEDVAGPDLLPRDGPARLIREALKPEQASAAMDRLLAEASLRQERVRIMGRELPTPRLVAWHGEKAYAYSGLVHRPSPMPPELERLRGLCQRLADARFNSVLLNLYRDGRDSMGFHADDEPELGPGPVIASLSLGATRRFRFKHKTVPGLSVGLDLTHGSLLVMAGAVQRCWLHGLPKTAKPVGPRLNLTFRLVR